MRTSHRLSSTRVVCICSALFGSIQHPPLAQRLHSMPCSVRMMLHLRPRLQLHIHTAKSGRMRKGHQSNAKQQIWQSGAANGGHHRPHILQEPAAAASGRCSAGVPGAGGDLHQPGQVLAFQLVAHRGAGHRPQLHLHILLLHGQPSLSSRARSTTAWPRLGASTSSTCTRQRRQLCSKVSGPSSGSLASSLSTGFTRCCPWWCSSPSPAATWGCRTVSSQMPALTPSSCSRTCRWGWRSCLSACS